MNSIQFVERNSFFDERDFADATEVISVTDAHTALKLKELETILYIINLGVIGTDQGMETIKHRIEQLNKEVKHIK